MEPLEILGFHTKIQKATVYQEFCHTYVYRRDEKLCKELESPTNIILVSYFISIVIAMCIDGYL